MMSSVSIAVDIMHTLPSFLFFCLLLLLLSRSLARQATTDLFNNETIKPTMACGLATIARLQRPTTAVLLASIRLHQEQSGICFPFYISSSPLYSSLRRDWSKRAETGRLTTRREDIWMMITSIVVDRRRQRAHGQRRWMVMNHT